MTKAQSLGVCLSLTFTFNRLQTVFQDFWQLFTVLVRLLLSIRKDNSTFSNYRKVIGRDNIVIICANGFCYICFGCHYRKNTLVFIMVVMYTDSERFQTDFKKGVSFAVQREHVCLLVVF